MTDTLERAKALLHSGGFSVAIINASDIYTSKKSGIAPLMDILAENPSFLNGSAVADRVIGKAAAMLMLFGNVSEVYTDVISTHALEAFDRYGINAEYSECVPYIINRSGDGMCPMEKAVLDVDEPKEAYEVLKKKLEMMKK